MRAISATRRVSSEAVAPSTPRPWTRRWPRSTACRDAISSFWTTTCSAARVLLRPSSTGCAAWDGCGRPPRPCGGVLQPGLLEQAAAAGLRSLFVGFETLNPTNLAAQGKGHNIGRDYAAAIRRLHDQGVMINASFVFGMDEDDTSVFQRTVEWAVAQGIETATFHILTPYPGTALYDRMAPPGGS